MYRSRSGACASTTPQGSTIIERPPERMAARMAAHLVGGNHKRLVLDRARPDERLPVVACGRQRERRGQRDHARAAHGEDAEQLGKAQVVADRQPSSTPSGGLAEHDLLARMLDVGLAVGACRRSRRRTCAACGRPPAERRAGSTCTQVLASFSSPATRSAIDPATRSTPSSRAVARAQEIAGPSSVSAPSRSCWSVPITRPLLGEYDQARAVRRSGACETIGRGEVRGRRRRWSSAGLPRPSCLIPLPQTLHPQNRLTSQSTLQSIAPHGPQLDTRMFRGTRPLKRWRYVGVFCEELMACAAVVQVGPARQSFWAVHPRSDVACASARACFRDEVACLNPDACESTTAACGSISTLEEDAGIQALCMHGREQVWTRKQAGVAGARHACPRRRPRA